MHLTIREEERIQLWAAAEMARRRLDRGIKLNTRKQWQLSATKFWSVRAKAAFPC